MHSVLAQLTNIDIRFHRDKRFFILGGEKPSVRPNYNCNYSRLKVNLNLQGQQRYAGRASTIKIFTVVLYSPLEARMIMMSNGHVQ